MTVTVRLFGGLRRFTGGCAEFTKVIDPGTCAWEIVIALGIPENEVYVVAVNGVRVAKERELCDGDKVDIFAPIEGG